MDGSHQPRRRAIAATDALIAHAEQLRDAQALVLRELTAAGHNTRRAAILFKLTEERIERLRASRHYLVDVESTEAGPA